MKRKLTAFLAGIALACTAHAQSFFELEAGIGGSAYSNGGDGYWYQQGYEHNLQLTAPAIEAGITGDLYQSAHWGVSYHIDYAWLGSIHTQSYAVTDPDYSTTLHHCIKDCANTANFLGAGHEQGFIFTIEPHYDIAGWRFGVEAGPFLHHSVWSEDVDGLGHPYFAADGGSVTVKSTDGWRVGAVVGAEVSYKHASLVYQHFFTQTSGANPGPPIWHSVDFLFVRYTADIF